jgi:hypothetical protein
MITEIGGGVSSGQIELPGQIWTLSSVPNEIWKDSDYEGPRKFCNLSNDEYNSEFQSRIRKLRPVEVG